MFPVFLLILAGLLLGTCRFPVQIFAATPLATITSPTTGDRVRGNVEIEVRFRRPHVERMVRHFEVYLDGDIYDAVEVGEYIGTYTSSWETTGISDGLHTLRVYAYTEAEGGSAEASNEVVVVVDNTPPELEELTPAEGSYATSYRPTVGATATDSTSGIAPESIRMKLDGSPVDPGYDSVTGRIDFQPGLPLSETAHTAEVMVADEAGNQATVSWSFTVDVTPPVITITAPLDKDLTNQLAVMVIGSVDDLVAVVKVNEVEVVLGDGAFSQEIVLTEGENIIRVTAVDQVGNSRSQMIQVNKDMILPEIALFSPQTGDAVKNSPITVTGNINDITAAVTVNDETVAVDPVSGNFSADGVALTNGFNEITAMALDPAGNSASASVTVILDSISPVITITTPEDGTVTGQTAIDVSGTVNDVTAMVTVDEVDAAVDPDGRSYTATNLLLTEGMNNIQARAVDSAGNLGIDEITVVRDTAPPVLAITAPADGFITNQVSQTVTGTVNDAAAAVTVDGVTVPVSGGTFSWTVTLMQGENTIFVTATDVIGNGSTVSVTGTLDNQEPPAPILDAVPTLTKKTRLVVTGTSEQGTLVRITGVQAPASSMAEAEVPGTFSVTLLLTPNAENDLSATATDAVGNVSDPAPVLIIHDGIDPALSVTAPEEGAIFPVVDSDPPTTITVSVSGTTSDLHGISGVTVNGTEVTVTEGSFETTVELTVPGALGFLSQTIEVIATDNAGNTTTVNRGVEVELVWTDNSPPVVTITEPAEGSFSNQSTISLAGTLSDASAIVSSHYEVNGAGSFSLSTGASFSASAVLTVEGENTIVVYAEDELGNPEGSDTVVVTLITTPPEPPAINLVNPSSPTNYMQVSLMGMYEPGYTVRITGGTAVAEAVVSGAGMYSVVVSLAENTENLLYAWGLDRAGNISLTSTDVTVIQDLIAPSVETMNPAEGATEVPLDQAVTMTFTEEMAAGTLVDENIRLEASGARIAASLTIGPSNETVTITPDADLDDSIEVTVRVAVQATDVAGNGLSPVYSGTFTTVDLTPPGAVVLSPAPPTLTNLDIVDISGYTEPGATVTIEGEDVSVWSGIADGTGHFTITVSLVQNQSNSLSIFATDTAPAGNVGPAVAPTIIHDNIGPEVETFYPSDGTSEIPYDQTVTIIFDDPLSAATVPVTNASAANITVNDGSGIVPGNFILNGAKTTVNFVVTGAFSDSSQVTVTVTDGVTDLAGNPLQTETSASFAIVDNTPPDAPVVTGLNPESPTNAVLVTLTGTAEEGSTVRVEGGTAAGETVADGTNGAFSVTVGLNPDDTNLLLVTATDASNNKSVAAEIQVVQDSTLPQVSGVVPADGSTGAAIDGSVVISFSEPINPTTATGALTLAPEFGEEVTGEMILAGENSTITFTAYSDLGEGTLHTLTISTQIEDPAGNTQAAPFVSTFTTEGNPPILVPGTPVLDQVQSPTTSNLITITGTAEPDTTIDVTGGASAAQTTVDGDGNFSLTVALTQNRINTLSVTSSNQHGPSPAATLSVRHDTLGPTILILSPEAGTEFPASPIPVVGTVVDLSGIEGNEVDVNGDAVILAGETFAITEFTLSKESNTITATASDTLGNEAEASVDVTFAPGMGDVTAPIVTITDPREGELVLAQCRIAGTVVDESPITDLKIDQIGILPDDFGRFGTTVLLEDGTHTLTVTAVDAEGLEGTDSVTVTVDATPPTLEIDYPPTPFTTAFVTIEVTGATEAGAAVEITNGTGTFSEIAGPDGSFNIEVTLSENVLNFLRVTASDGVGNRSDPVNLEVTHDDQPFYVEDINPPFQASSVLLESMIRITFSRAVDEDSLVTPGNLSIRAENQTIQGNISLTSGGRIATFTPYEILPGNSDISIVISSDILSLDGMNLMYEFVSSFTTEQAPTSLSGTVLTPDLLPLVGATVRIRGTPLETTVTSLGGFIFIDDVPPGIQELVVDGSTTGVDGSFSTMVVRTTIVESRDNIVPGIIVVPSDTNCTRTVTGNVNAIDFTDCIPHLTLSFNAGAVVFPDGSLSGDVSATVIGSNNLPGRLPDNSVPSFLVRIEPEDLTISPAATITMPNPTGLAAGEEITIFSFVEGPHNYGEIGSGTVDASGDFVSIDVAGLTGLGYIGFFPTALEGQGPRYLHGRVVDNGGIGLVGIPVNALSVGEEILTAAAGYYEIPLPSGDLSDVVVFATVPGSLSGDTRGNVSLVYTSSPVDPAPGTVTEVPDIVVDSFQLLGDIRLVDTDGETLGTWEEDTFGGNGRLLAVSSDTLSKIKISVYREESPGIFSPIPLLTTTPKSAPLRSGNHARFDERIFNGPEIDLPPGERSPVRFEPGELLRIIAYSPEIGYVGLVEARIPDFSSGGAELEADILLHPPRVRIRAEKIFYANDLRRRRNIPHGGVALLSDQLILIYTNWIVPDIPGAVLYGRIFTDAVFGNEKDLRFTIPPGESLRVLEIRGTFSDSQVVLETVSVSGNESVEISPERSFREERILPLITLGPAGYLDLGIKMFQFRVSSDTEIGQINMYGIIVDPPDENGDCLVTGITGVVEAGAIVIITNLDTDVTVSVTAEENGSFTAIIPGDIGDILEIISEDESGNRSDPIYLEIIAIPGIDSITPSHANNEETVVIEGRYFSAVPGENEVRFSTPYVYNALAEVTSASTTSLTVTVPEEAVTGLVTVTVGGETSNGDLFTVTTPKVIRLTPDTGVAGESASIFVEAEYTHFDSGSAVSFGPYIIVNSVQWDSDTALTTGITISSSALLGLQEVSVTTDDQVLYYDRGFNIINTAPPVIDWIKNLGPGLVQLHGDYYRPNLVENRVYFDGRLAVLVDATTTTIDARIPPGFTGGYLQVAVDQIWSNSVFYAIPTPTPTPSPTAIPGPSATPTPEGYHTPSPTATSSVTPPPTATQPPTPSRTPPPPPTATPFGYKTPSPTSTPTTTPFGYQTPSPTPSPRPGERFDNPIVVTLNHSSDGSTTGYINDYIYYGYDNSAEFGPDVVYIFTPDTAGTITASLTGITSDLDLFLCNSPSGYDLVRASTNGAIIDEEIIQPISEAGTGDTPAGTQLYLVVDGYDSAEGPYHLDIMMTTPAPNRTPPPVPTATPVGFKTPTPFSTVSPPPTIAPTATPAPSSTPVGYYTPTPQSTPTAIPKPTLTPVPSATPPTGIPYIVSVIVQPNNDILVIFNEDVSSDQSIQVGLNKSDIDFVVTPNGGNSLVDFNLFGIDNSHYMITIILTGLARGVETVTVSPNTGISIFDGDGNPVGVFPAPGNRPLYNEWPQPILWPELVPGEITTTPIPTPTPREETTTFKDTADVQSYIYVCLRALDQIKRRCDAGEIGDIEKIRDLFFSPGDGTAITANVEALAVGVAVPEMLDRVVAEADGRVEGEYPHYAHTGLFYSSVLAFAGKQDALGAVNPEDTSFGYGCLAHYVVDKHINPVVQGFAGGVYRVGGEQVADFDYYHGTETGSISTAAVAINMLRHRWVKSWMIKEVFYGAGATAWNSSSELIDDLDYYQIRELYDSEIEIIEDTYDYLWEITSVPGLVGASAIIKQFTEDVAFAHQSDYRLKAGDVAHLTVFPDSDQLHDGFNKSMADIGYVDGVYYYHFSSDYLLALEMAADEVAELFIRTVPYLEDDLLSKISVRDTRIQNLDLYTGKLCDPEIIPCELPDLTGQINPGSYYFFVANGDGMSMSPVEVLGDRISDGSPINLGAVTAEVASGPTGRFAYVSMKTGPPRWVDMTPNDKLRLPVTDALSEEENGEEGSGGPLIVTPDSSRLYACRGSNINIYDLKRREYLSADPNNPLSMPYPAWDIDMSLKGYTLCVSCPDPLPDAGWGQLEVYNAALIDPMQYDPPLSVNSNTASYILEGSIRGVGLKPDGGKAYVATAGTGTGRHHQYKDPMWTVDLKSGTVSNIQTYIPDSSSVSERYSWIIRQEVYSSYLMVSPYILNILSSIYTPPYLSMDISDTSPYDRWNLACVSPGFMFLFPVIGATPCMFVVTYSVNPVGTYEGTDCGVPSAIYPSVGPVTFLGFDMSGNIGFHKQGSDEMYAATTNQLGFLELGQSYSPLNKIAVSQVGDVAGIHYGKDSVSYGVGKNIFKALGKEGLHDFSREAIDNLPRVERVFTEGINFDGINNPVGVDFQPLVYIVWPLTGQSVEVAGEEGVSYMIFSRNPIDSIDIDVELGPNVVWTQQGDRYWELVVRDVTKAPFDTLPGEAVKASNINFTVRFKDGPDGSIRYATAEAPVVPLNNESAPVIQAVPKNHISGRILFRPNNSSVPENIQDQGPLLPKKPARVPIVNADVCLIEKSEWSSATYWTDYNATEDGADVLTNWVKNIPPLRRKKPNPEGTYYFDVKAIGERYASDGPVDYYLVAQTRGSNASRQRPATAKEKKLVKLKFRPKPWNDGEAANFYTDGLSGQKPDKEHDWKTYHDPFATPDITISKKANSDDYEVSAGAVKAPAGTGIHQADIIFPYPMIWIHGVNLGGTGGHPSGNYEAITFFSHPDPSSRSVVDCALSYNVSTMNTAYKGCKSNAKKIEEYMKEYYDTGINAITPKGKQPQNNVIAHSMGGPISRIWLCDVDEKGMENVGSHLHGGVINYISCSAIHGGNLMASNAPRLKSWKLWGKTALLGVPFGPWGVLSGALLPWGGARLLTGNAAFDCGVANILKYDKFYNNPDGKWYFAWGIDGYGGMGKGAPAKWGLPGEKVTNIPDKSIKYFAIEGYPNDGENSSPTAACQNGPYLTKNKKTGAYELGQFKWHLDRDIDMRATKFGKAVFAQKDPGRMGYVDFKIKPLECPQPLPVDGAPEPTAFTSPNYPDEINSGTHGAVFTNPHSSRSQADWLEMGPDPGIAPAYKTATDFARWPDPYNMPRTTISGPSPGDKGIRTVDSSSEPPILRGGADEDGEEFNFVFSDQADISPGSHKEYRVPVDESSKLSVCMVWEDDSPLALNLLSPSGMLITPESAPSNPSVEYEEEISRYFGSISIFSVSDPEPGFWTLRVVAGSLSPGASASFSLDAAVYSTLVLNPIVAGRDIAAGGTIVIGAEVSRNNDDFSFTRLTDRITIKAELIEVDGGATVIALYDDGLHSDSAAGDGIFAAPFVCAKPITDYVIGYKASGVSDQGEVFWRMWAEDFEVGSAALSFSGAGGSRASTDHDRKLPRAEGEPRELYSSLVFDVDLNVVRGGTFLIAADIYSPEGKRLGTAATEVSLSSGPRVLELSFNGRPIGDCLEDGPYSIENISFDEVVEIPSSDPDDPEPDERLYSGIVSGDVLLTEAYSYLEFIFTDDDFDGMADRWEEKYFGDLSHPGDGDDDGDGLTDLWEYRLKLDPTVADTDEDTTVDGDEDNDGDIMPNGWEASNGLDPRIDDAGQDPDEDGFSNLEEYQAGTDPQDRLSYPGMATPTPA